jgi:hypothetical protein
LMHLSELQSFEAEKKNYHVSCTCSFTAGEVERKKR